MYDVWSVKIRWSDKDTDSYMYVFTVMDLNLYINYIKQCRKENGGSYPTISFTHHTLDSLLTTNLDVIIQLYALIAIYQFLVAQGTGSETLNYYREIGRYVFEWTDRKGI